MRRIFRNFCRECDALLKKILGKLCGFCLGGILLRGEKNDQKGGIRRGEAVLGIRRGAFLVGGKLEVSCWAGKQDPIQKENV